MSNYYDATGYLLSSKFNILNLSKGMKMHVDKLAEYRVNPVSKREIRYLITEILKETKILEDYCNAVYDEELDEETINELEKNDLDRNAPFLAESSKAGIVSFYQGQKYAQETIRNQCYSRLK